MSVTVPLVTGGMMMVLHPHAQAQGQDHVPVNLEAGVLANKALSYRSLV